MNVGAAKESFTEEQEVVNCQAMTPTYKIAKASAAVLAHLRMVPQAG